MRIKVAQSKGESIENIPAGSVMRHANGFGDRWLKMSNGDVVNLGTGVTNSKPQPHGWIICNGVYVEEE